MSAIDEIGLTKYQQRNLENKEKLLDAMEQIMEHYDYNTVTIRNICKVSGISYGSFYNLFKSKEAFLRYYLTSDFSRFMDNYYHSNKTFDSLSSLEKSIDGFICCAHYNVEKGLHFICGFYSPNNHSLFPSNQTATDEHSFEPLILMAKKYLDEAKESGELSSTQNTSDIANTLCYIFNGITFNWCLSQGQFDIISKVKDILLKYIQTL